jgi:hypothetical protein
MEYTLYIQHVYGNATGNHLALRGACKKTEDPLRRRWLDPWHIPTEILTKCGGLMVDREFLCHGRSHGEWSYRSGRCGYGDKGWIEVEIDVDDLSISHTELELSVDNKWSLWSKWGLDGGYDFIEPLFRAMPIGSQIHTKLACWKEIRYGEFNIFRNKSNWHVCGEMHTCWDDDSRTEHDFDWCRRSVKHVMKQLDDEESTLLEFDEIRSKNAPMVEEDEDEDEEEEG